MTKEGFYQYLKESKKDFSYYYGLSGAWVAVYRGNSPRAYEDSQLDTDDDRAWYDSNGYAIGSHRYSVMSAVASYISHRHNIDTGILGLSPEDMTDISRKATMPDWTFHA